MNYDFSQLNDKEFENIVCDLISKSEGKSVDRFKPGKDKGVDGRFFSSSGETIIQCKHYLRSGYNKFLEILKKFEKDKLVALSPKRYILATSLPLSLKNKKDIRKIFHPYILSDEDIFGQENLNFLITKFPEIETRHFKLWLSSTNVLVQLLNQAIKGRSEFELRRIAEKARKFVPTNDFEKAKEILKERNVVILTGEPGIGKTTLAESLCLLYYAHEFEIVVIEESLSEAESVYDKTKQQLFYFDDFLGSNYLEAIEGKKDSHIVNFIDRVKKDSGKKFVLTSRTNIFTMGINFSSIFYNRKIQTSEFLLSIASLANIDKAKILYNHIWFSDLPEQFIDQIYQGKNYWQIIQHKNFSPRLVEFVTDLERLQGISENDYWAHVSQTFQNPVDIWDNCFKVQSNQQVRNLVLLTVFNGGEISEKDLQVAFGKLNIIQNLPYSTETDRGFKSSSVLATKSFLIRLNRRAGFFYQLFNPSISDYVITEHRDNSDEVLKIFFALSTLKSLKQLDSIKREKLINLPEDVSFKIFRESIVHNKSFEYQIFAAFRCSDIKDCSSEIVSLLKLGINERQELQNMEYFFQLLDAFWESLSIESPIFLNQYLEDVVLESDEAFALVCLYENHLSDNKQALSMLHETIKSHIHDEVDRRSTEEAWGDYVEFEEGYDGDTEKVVDFNGILRKLVSIGEDILSDFASTLVNDLNIDVEEAIEGIDQDKLVSDIDFSTHDNSWEEKRSNLNSLLNDIDDLFEREPN